MKQRLQFAFLITTNTFLFFVGINLVLWPFLKASPPTVRFEAPVSEQNQKDTERYLNQTRPFVPYLHIGEPSFESPTLHRFQDRTGYSFRGVRAPAKESIFLFGSRKAMSLYVEDTNSLDHHLANHLHIPVRNYAARDYGPWEMVLLFRRLLLSGEVPKAAIFLSDARASTQETIANLLPLWEMRQEGLSIIPYFEPLPLFALWNRLRTQIHKRKVRPILESQYPSVSEDGRLKKESPSLQKQIFELGRSFEVATYFLEQPDCSTLKASFCESLRPLRLTEQDFSGVYHQALAFEITQRLQPTRGDHVL